MGIFNEFFKKEKPLFTGLKFGFGGGGAGVIPEDPFTASGGTESTPGDGYIYHVFDYVYPHSHNFTCTAPSAGVTVEVMCQGSGGGGGSRSNPGPSTKPSTGGNGGATGVWDLTISAPGDYPVTVGQGSVSTFHGTNPYPDAGKDGNPRSSSRISNASNPSQYIQGSNGARGGFNGSPNEYTGPAGPAATNLTNWPAATNTGDFQPQISLGPSGNPEYNGPLWMPGRPAGGQPQPTSLWWRPYISPGNAGGGPQGGNGSNYGGGGGGYESGQPPGTDNGSGGNGRVVIRYLESLIE
jgi:hypothetical protein